MSARQTEALLLDRDLRLRLGSRELAAPRQGQALVRVEWAGVCGSDLHVLRTGDWVDYWPATLGHEFVGVVRSCPGGEFAAGARVVADSRVPCRDCPGCASAPNRCERQAWVGEAFPGGFAGHCVLDVRNLLACPETVEPAVAVLAEPLAVAQHAINRAAVDPARILLLGYGPLGALTHRAAADRWPDVPIEVVEPMPERRELAAASGARAVEPGQAGRADLVIDAAGYPRSLTEAMSLCVNGGTVVVVALGHEPVPVHPGELAERSLSLVGVNGFDRELPVAVERIAADPDRYRPVITEALLLDEAVARLPELGERPSVGKVVIAPWHG
ncbi:zinc-dependent alcohol dehydrogenase [Sciscionella sediminilitoris]|uniref:zinc-dependent alcohol dehydrogenase n=1 Tax=Sciscionella sediminilitoris TaxID=1445613 RepID=UPI00068F34AB|nr:alcohol dehydrogenase catalytic domain-containing protein [Sciscionella sp. SE31]